MEGSVVLNIEEDEKTEKKDPIIREGRITESFEIQMDQIDTEVEKKLKEIANMKCEKCECDELDADVKYCIQATFCFAIAFHIFIFTYTF